MPLLRTYVFLVPVIAMMLSECVKAAIDYRRTGHWSDGMFRPGGMPSTHSAFVTSLLIVIARRNGFESSEFAIAFVFAAVVWYDAISLRRTVGEQASILNTLQRDKHLRERVGHSAREMLAGIAFGSVITIIGIWFDRIVAGIIG
jgi:acid phosphatase family membrane protein YuiD